MLITSSCYNNNIDKCRLCSAWLKLPMLIFLRGDFLKNLSAGRFLLDIFLIKEKPQEMVV